MKSILGRSFKYTQSSNMDLRKKFAKVRREQRLSTKPMAGQKSIGQTSLSSRLGRCLHIASWAY
jgi:hypothetical protein